MIAYIRVRFATAQIIHVVPIHHDMDLTSDRIIFEGESDIQLYEIPLICRLEYLILNYKEIERFGEFKTNFL